MAGLGAALSEREPQPQSVTPHAGGARPPLGSGGPSRSESAAEKYDHDDDRSFLILVIRESYGDPVPCSRCATPTRWQLTSDPDYVNDPRCFHCCAAVLALHRDLDAYIAANP